MENETICPKCNSTEMGIAFQTMHGALFQDTTDKSWIKYIKKFHHVGILNHVICKNCGFVVYSFTEGYKNLK